MSYKPLGSNQTINRSVLQQLFPWVAGQTLDILLTSINAQVTPPFVVDATLTPSLVLNVGPSNVANPESDRNSSATFIGSVIPKFTSGTVTFPSTSGGNITTSTGGSTPLVLPSGEFVAVLLSIDTSNNLGASVGVPAASAALTVVPAPEANTLPFAYAIVQNIGGTIQNITQSNVFQLVGGGSGGSGGGGIAQEVPLTIGTTSIAITYATPRSDTSYSLISQLVNVVDADPMFQPITITDKTTTGFTASWDAPLETSNYTLDFVIAPGVSLQAGEFIVSMGTTSATMSFPIAFLSTSYVVVSQLDDYVDPNPQFQPLTVTSKTLSQFIVSWNAPVSSNNYRISWMVGAYQ